MTNKSSDGSYCIRNDATCPPVRIILKITAKYAQRVRMCMCVRCVRVCVFVGMHSECSETETENTPRCTRYAFQWAGYQRRIHPIFHVGMHLFFFSLSSSFPLFSLSHLNFGRGFLRLIHTCNTPQKCYADGKSIRTNQLHFISAKRAETRDAFHVFLHAAISLCSFVDVLREFFITIVIHF